MLNLMPLSNRRSVFSYLDDMEKEFFSDFPASFSSFRTDIQEDEQCYTLKADLPGFKKEDISLELKDNILAIAAGQNEESEEKTDNYIRRERRTGSFYRTFDVSGIDTTAIEASYEDGVLTLRLPKLALQEPEVQKIQIN